MTKHRGGGSERRESKAEVLFPEIPEAIIGGIFRLPMEIIIPNPEQPRKLFDSPLIAQMAESMRERGDTEYPLIVTPRNVKDQRRALIVDGERRWKAAGLIGLTHISCYIREMMSNEKAFFTSTRANLCRAEMTPIEQAFAIKIIMEKKGWNQARTARELGLNPITVGNFLRYLKLIPDIQALVATGKLGKGVALRLAEFKPSDQTVLLQSVDRAVKERKRPFSNDDLMIFLRKKAEELKLHKPLPSSKKHAALSSADLSMRQLRSRMSLLGETVDGLLEIPPKQLRDWKKNNPFDLLGDIDDALRKLKRLREWLDEKVVD